MQDTVVIMDERNLPHYCCNWYELFLPRVYLNNKNPDIALCAKGDKCKKYRLSTEEACSRADTDFRSYGRSLVHVASFKYPGHLHTAMENNWLEIMATTRKARRKWKWMSRILVWERSYKSMSITFSKLLSKTS